MDSGVINNEGEEAMRVLLYDGQCLPSGYKSRQPTYMDNVSEGPTPKCFSSTSAVGSTNHLGTQATCEGEDKSAREQTEVNCAMLAVEGTAKTRTKQKRKARVSRYISQITYTQPVTPAPNTDTPLQFVC